jgi:CBS domain-containing protein
MSGCLPGVEDRRRGPYPSFETTMKTTVKDLMTAPARTVRSDDTLYLAAEAMWEGDCGGVPVVDGDGKLSGFVTDRDITMCAAIQGRTLHELPVTAAMSFDAASVTAGESVGHAHGLLRERQVRRLPVVDEAGAVVGVLSLADLVRDAAAHPTARSRTQDVRATVTAVSATPGSPAPAATKSARASRKSAAAAKKQAAGSLSPKATKKPTRKAAKPTAPKAVKKAVKSASAKAVKKAVKKAAKKAAATKASSARKGKAAATSSRKTSRRKTSTKRTGRSASARR